MKIVDPILEEIKKEALRDGTQCELKKAIMNGFPEKARMALELAEYYKVKDKLTLVDDLILYGTRVVVPQKLRAGVLKNLHAAHQGQERTLQRARQCVHINHLGTPAYHKI